MVKLGLGLLVAGLLAGSVSTAPARCALKKIENGLYCTECERLLEKDEVLKESFCKECSESAEMDGNPPVKASKVQVCVRTYYECQSCGDTSKTEKNCKECEAEREESTDRSRILFACENCGKEFQKEGSCDEEECKESKAKVVKTCEASGTFPHDD